MTTIFALSGGGNLGPVQVGMLRALAEVGIVPDAIVGTSVGAVNGGWLADQTDRSNLDDLCDLWTGLRRSNIFPLRFPLSLAGFVGRRSHFVPNDNLRALLSGNIGFERLENARIPFHVVAADVLTGESVLLSEGPSIDAILASAAIPGIYPPIEIEGRTLVDGGIIDGTPISHAVALGASTVWALPTGFSCGLEQPPKGALAMILHAVGVLGGQQLARDIELFRTRVNLHVVPPPCPLDVLPHDFTKAGLMIERAYEQTSAWLGAGAPELRAAMLTEPDLRYVHA